LNLDLDIDLMDLLGLVLGRDNTEVGLDLDLVLDLDKELGFGKGLGSGVMDKSG
jgi:hypothetical protein